jgi:hypothetical protein
MEIRPTTRDAGELGAGKGDSALTANARLRPL